MSQTKFSIVRLCLLPLFILMVSSQCFSHFNSIENLPKGDEPFLIGERHQLKSDDGIILFIQMDNHYYYSEEDLKNFKFLGNPYTILCNHGTHILGTITLKESEMNELLNNNFSITKVREFENVTEYNFTIRQSNGEIYNELTLWLDLKNDMDCGYYRDMILRDMDSNEAKEYFKAIKDLYLYKANESIDAFEQQIIERPELKHYLYKEGAYYLHRISFFEPEIYDELNTRVKNLENDR